MALGQREVGGVYADELFFRSTDGGNASIPRLRVKNRKRKSRKNRKHVKHSRRYSVKRRTKRRSKSVKSGRMAKGRVRKTKNGQPYIIMANGRARFIKRRR